MLNSGPLISFGIIVLNGEPFTRYCLRALYPHAHQIIVVEGACPGSKSVASPDGHSTDGTLSVVRDFCSNEDPEHKLLLVTAEDEGYKDGFWLGEKDEMSRAYASKANGEYLWQVDVDEFYHDEAIVKIKKLLVGEPSISAVSFRQIQFWGGFRYLVDSWILRRGGHDFHRLFKWGSGYVYTSHRPPTVTDEEGRDLRSLNWIRAAQTHKMNIILHHYSFVFPKQVQDKAQYYKNATWSMRKDAEWWANDVFMKLKDPFRVFSVYKDISWLIRFNGEHPGPIKALMQDLNQGVVNTQLRHTSDIERLLNNPGYIIKRTWYIIMNPVNEIFHRYKKSLNL